MLQSTAGTRNGRAFGGPARRSIEVLDEDDVSATIRVSVADGHSLSLHGMQGLLDFEDDIDVVSTSSNLEDAVRHVRGHRPDVLVYDPPESEPPSAWLAALSVLADASPETAIIVVGPDGEAGIARAVLQSDAAGFVTKGEGAGALAEAVRRVASGDSYINPRLGIQIVRLDASEEADGLTEREKELLQLIALGYTNAEIAGMLFISTRTVESHRANIREKLGCENRAELVRYALDRHLIS